MMSKDTTPKGACPNALVFHRELAVAGEKPEDWIDQFGQLRGPATEMWLEPEGWLEIEGEAAERRIQEGLVPIEHRMGWALYHGLTAFCLEERRL